MVVNSDFKPAWWLSNPHVQTIAAKWLRRKLVFNGHVETLETPDNDFIDLVWTQIPDKSTTKPIVVVLHGLAGSVDSHYAKGLLTAITAKGWIGVLMHFRGCSGRPNRQGPSYHSGDTRDINYLTQWLEQHYPNAPLSVVGFSLGGNVLTRYLAQVPGNPYKAACIICAPLDLSSCSKKIGRGFSKIYQKYLVDMLKTATREKMEMNLLPQVCSIHLSSITKMWDFDQHVTAPINGFEGAEHYYRQASGKFVIGDIKNNSLFIHAADDPFLDHETIVPHQPLPEHLTFEVCRKGGHVGFISGRNPMKPLYWLDKRIPDYLEQHL
ncbi:hydrolase [Thalassotalea atypica]|uniref:hydrolase n=1 Tax=Thalassotalea atypica TaxID=2054316 RepID=UPI00257225E4|nr:hydrolase [Thalassotalea atypica]